MNIGESLREKESPFREIFAARSATKLHVALKSGELA